LPYCSISIIALTVSLKHATILSPRRTWREKEASFKREQESSKRKEELNEQLKQLQEEDKSLEKEMIPLRTELMQKESDRNRLRDSNAQTDSMLSGKVKDFDRDTDQLHSE
jgi:cell shape-determining protein MreC